MIITSIMLSMGILFLLYIIYYQLSPYIPGVHSFIVTKNNNNIKYPISMKDSDAIIHWPLVQLYIYQDHFVIEFVCKQKILFSQIIQAKRHFIWIKITYKNDSNNIDVLYIISMLNIGSIEKFICCHSQH